MPPILLTLLETAIVSFFTKLVGATISEKLIAKLFFALADWLAAHSGNMLDDEAVQDVKNAYFGK